MSVAIENNTPGVTAVVNTTQVSRPLERQPTSTFFAAGYAAWGPVLTATLVTSWAEFVRIFGGLNSNSYLADAAYIFFNQFGGRQMIVSRVVGATPVVATKTLNDRAGTPVPTIRVDAKYPSSSVDIKVTVAAGTAANTVKFTFQSVLLGITEVFDDFLVDAANIALVNDKSKLVKLTNLNSATVAPNNLPAVAAASSLTSGNDDFAGISDFSTGLAAFNDEQLGTGQVAIPGVSTVHAALISHCQTYKRLALLDPALGTSLSSVQTVAGTNRSVNAALYYPWVKMSNFNRSGSTKFYPPSAFAAGACAQVDRTIGTHKAPANLLVPGALDVERNSDGTPIITDSAREALNAKQVNAIAPIAGEGIKIYGARVLYPSGETRVRFVHEQRLLNLIYYTAKQGFSWAVFAVVDGQGRLFRDIRAAGANFLRNLWRAGALYGRTEQEAFVVVCDESNNPPDQVEQGRVNVQLGVKLSPTAEQIFVAVDSVPLGQDLNILNGGIN